MNVGIVGHEGAKFTLHTEALARAYIRQCLGPGDTLVSGACHLGGIDIWAEEEATVMSLPTLIFPPNAHSWNEGYKPRNIQIAEHSDMVVVIVVATYPPTYTGMRFSFCYHCKTKDHIKSGGCWTGKYAQKRGKGAFWYVVE